MKEIATEMKVEKVLYHWTVTVRFSTSLFKVDHDERPHSHNVADDLKKRRQWQLSCNDGTTKTGTWHHPVLVPYALQARGNKFRHREGIQRWKRTLFAGIVSGDADRKLGTPPACDCTHLPNTRGKCRSTHANQKEQPQGTQNHPQHPQLTRALTSRVWHHCRSGLQRSRQPDGKCPSPKFARRPTKPRHSPRTQNCTNG